MAQSCTAPGPLGHLPAVAPASGAARRRWWRRGRGMRSHIVAEKVIRYHGVISKAKQINEQNRRQALWRRACGDMKPQRQGVETAGSRSQATRRVVQHPSCRGQAAHRPAATAQKLWRRLRGRREQQHRAGAAEHQQGQDGPGSAHCLVASPCQMGKARAATAQRRRCMRLPAAKRALCMPPAPSSLSTPPPAWEAPTPCTVA